MSEPMNRYGIVYTNWMPDRLYKHPATAIEENVVGTRVYEALTPLVKEGAITAADRRGLAWKVMKREMKASFRPRLVKYRCTEDT